MKSTTIAARAETDDMVRYLERERCTYCTVGKSPRECRYSVKRTYEGWHCYGYRSRLWDERP